MNHHIRFERVKKILIDSLTKKKKEKKRFIGDINTEGTRYKSSEFPRR